MRKKWNKNTWSVQKYVCVCGGGAQTHLWLVPPFSYTLIDPTSAFLKDVMIKLCWD